MNIMVMAGTSDANQVIEGLKNQIQKEVFIIATTVTVQGAELAMMAGADNTISRPLNQKEIVKTIKERDVDILVDATHPFAEEATVNAIISSEEAEIPYFRFERSKTILPADDHIYQVSSFPEAAQMALELTPGIIFHLAGVLTLHHLTKFIEPDRIVVRVLPTSYSIKKCQELGLPSENIIGMQGTFSKDFNRILMEEYGVGVVITKDSGKAGGTQNKIEAALEFGIPVVLVNRPEIPELASKTVFNSMEELFASILSND